MQLQHWDGWVRTWCDQSIEIRLSQHGLKSLRNISHTLLNLNHVEISWLLKSPPGPKQKNILKSKCFINNFLIRQIFFVLNACVHYCRSKTSRGCQMISILKERWSFILGSIKENWKRFDLFSEIKTWFMSLYIWKSFHNIIKSWFGSTSVCKSVHRCDHAYHKIKVKAESLVIKRWMFSVVADILREDFNLCIR